MSDTSLRSSSSSYCSERRNRSSVWFILINSFLILTICISAGLIAYNLHKQHVRDRERQRIKDEFRRKYRISNKILDVIMKDGIVYRWLKAHKGKIATTFKELFQDISQTVFNE